jgi:hypothetical protein
VSQVSPKKEMYYGFVVTGFWGGIFFDVKRRLLLRRLLTG